MPNTNFSVKYKPLKIGFLVRDGSIEDLVTVAKLNSLLWGGLHNPVIPVKEDGDDAIKLIQRLPVDILHPVMQTDGIKNVLKRFPFLRSPRHLSCFKSLRPTHSMGLSK